MWQVFMVFHDVPMYEETTKNQKSLSYTRFYDVCLSDTLNLIFWNTVTKINQVSYIKFGQHFWPPIIGNTPCGQIIAQIHRWWVMQFRFNVQKHAIYSAANPQILVPSVHTILKYCPHMSHQRVSWVRGMWLCNQFTLDLGSASGRDPSLHQLAISSGS
jgi:hypothetical protein